MRAACTQLSRVKPELAALQHLSGLRSSAHIKTNLLLLLCVRLANFSKHLPCRTANSVPPPEQNCAGSTLYQQRFSGGCRQVHAHTFYHQVTQRGQRGRFSLHHLKRNWQSLRRIHLSRTPSKISHSGFCMFQADMGRKRKKKCGQKDFLKPKLSISDSFFSEATRSQRNTLKLLSRPVSGLNKRERVGSGSPESCLRLSLFVEGLCCQTLQNMKTFLLKSIMMPA